jgi:hypothetical protein
VVIGNEVNMEVRYSQIPKKSPLRSMVILHEDSSGVVQREMVFKQKRRRGSKRLRPLEKTMRRMATAQGTAADDYLMRHKKSNAKKKNGWIKDINKNVMRSSRKGMRKLKIRIL